MSHKFKIAVRVTVTKFWTVEADNEEHAEAIYYDTELGNPDLIEPSEADFLYAELTQ